MNIFKFLTPLLVLSLLSACGTNFKRPQVVFSDPFLNERFHECMDREEAKPSQYRHTGEMPYVTCKGRVKRQYAYRDRDRGGLDFVINDRLVRLEGYNRCSATVEKIIGTSFNNFDRRTETLISGSWKEKNNHLKIETTKRTRGVFHSDFHYVRAHEVTIFQIVLRNQKGDVLGPVWSEPMYTPDGTPVDKYHYIHAGRAFHRGTAAADLLERICSLN